MAIRLNVQEQNRALREAIRSSANDFRSELLRYAWLLPELQERGLDPLRGILAQHRRVPDQDGMCHAGYWLSEDRKFFYFEILVTHGPPMEFSVEAWRDATSEVVVNPRQPGTGKSFGFIALEVMDELQAKTGATVA